MKQKEKKELAEMLSELLADSYVLYTKTQNYHWNVVDGRFDMLHKMFQEQYEELAEANDLVAEQVRIVEGYPPGSMKEFLALTRLKEAKGGKKGGDAAVKDLLNDHESVIESLRGMISRASELGDEGTADLMIERLRAHAKMAWFLRSHLTK